MKYIIPIRITDRELGLTRFDVFAPEAQSDRALIYSIDSSECSEIPIGETWGCLNFIDHDATENAVRKAFPKIRDVEWRGDLFFALDQEYADAVLFLKQKEKELSEYYFKIVDEAETKLFSLGPIMINN